MHSVNHNYNLQRFLDAQENMYSTALEEIKSGKKKSHWIWYIFPQLKGLGHSYNSNLYGIHSVDEAEAYYAHPILGKRLIEITSALLEWNGMSADDILGHIDALKVKSCATLFWEATEDVIFLRVLNAFYEGEVDRTTISLLFDNVRRCVLSLYTNHRDAFEQYCETVCDEDILRDLHKINELKEPSKKTVTHTCWRINEVVLLGDMFVENNQVFIGVFDTRAGPPGYGGISLDSVPYSIAVELKNRLLNYIINMTQKHHYTGLTDAEVLASREKYGVNILTPPEEQSTWDKIKDCMHFWLLKTILGLFAAAVIAIVCLNIANVTMPSNVWIGPVILAVLFFLTYLVAYLGGEWDEEEKKFDMDSLITILLAALVLSGAISFYQGVFGEESGFTPYFEPMGIAFAVLLATGVAHILEAKNEKTFQALNEVNDETLVKVIRNNNVCQVERKDIVVGDIVLLNTGEEVPADCILLEAEHLKLNESTLTGEPSCHKTTNEADFDKEATYPSNHIMKGTTILVGNCTAEVFAVGDKTACGKVFEAAQVREGEETPLSRKLNGLANLITTVSYIIAVLIIVGRVIVYFVQGNGDFASTEGTVDFIKYMLDTVMIAVTLIVVAVPEGLPMAVTLSLAFSMRRLMEQNTLPRTMHACETMGATSVICTDKTGTLTQNQMQVADTFFPQNTDMNLVEESISVNTTANLDYSDPNKIKAIGSPTEGALLLWLHNRGKNYLEQRETLERLDRIPFSTEIKYMATIVRSAVTGSRMLYITGAPDILLSLCGDANNQEYNDRLIAYQNKALRTLGLAYAEIGEENVIIDGMLNDTSKLKMLGIVAISDPIRKEVPAAIKECLDAGIKVKIVTGDTVGTAKEIGRQVGLWNDSDTDWNILTGVEVAAMSDDELKKRLPDVKIVSRARPNDKERVVRILKAMDEVVAVTGDGTNDAPALNAAHVGLSMGDGTAVAKEASDMTILDNSFGTISNAVMWGRSLYKNIKRFILFQMTVNVTACFIVLVGAFIGTESPLTVTQMLWVNLIMDTFAALALASLPPTHAVMKEKPRSIDEHILKGIGKPILGVGLTFAFICLAILLYFQHNDVVYLTNLFPLTWGSYDGVSAHELGLFFTIFVMLHFWYMFNAKAHFTHGSAFKGISWKNTRWFIIITAVIFVVQILLVEVPGLQEMFNVAKGGLGLMNWIIILAATSLVVWIGEITRPFKKS